MHKIIFFIALLLSGSRISGQTDSLRKVLTLQPAYDSIRVRTLLNLAYVIQNDTVAEALKYSNETLEISKAIKWQRGIALSYRQLGVTT